MKKIPPPPPPSAVQAEHQRNTGEEEDTGKPGRRREVLCVREKNLFEWEGPPRVWRRLLKKKRNQKPKNLLLRAQKKEKKKVWFVQLPKGQKNWRKISHVS